MRHVPVLLHEVIEALDLSPGKRIVDCTLGDAGHAEHILRRTAPNGRLLGIDVDPEAILRAKKFLHEFGDRVHFIRDNFSLLDQILVAASFVPVDGILMDFGWSTPQFEERGRGFSFHYADEPLDMRLSGKDGETAADIVNAYDEADLYKIFKVYGEEKQAKRIAAAIVEVRKTKDIKHVGELVEIILSVYRSVLKTDKEVPWIGGLHPATKSFQALRIAVNHELDVIETAIPLAINALAPGGRLAVISFHSLEDRIVKHQFKAAKGIQILTKKPIVCGKAEFDANPPSRSAKLRVIQKI